MGCRGIGRNYINSTSLRKLRPSRILGLSYDMTKFRLNPKPSFNHNCPKQPEGAFARFFPGFPDRRAALRARCWDFGPSPKGLPGGVPLL
jgi:hypothetical protein